MPWNQGDKPVRRAERAGVQEGVDVYVFVNLSPRLAKDIKLGVNSGVT